MNATMKMAMVGLATVFCVSPAAVRGQIPQLQTTPQDRRIPDLEAESLQLRAGIGAQRVDRQAEVSRLESEIDRLEERVASLEAQTAPRLWSFLEILDEGPAPAETEPQTGEASPADPGDAVAPAAESPPDATGAISDRRRAFAQLMAVDYLLAVEADLADARMELLKSAQSVASVQRLLAKGLAGSLQLEREQLANQQAAARVRRLEKQSQGLRELFPEVARRALEHPRSDELPAPERETTADR